MPYLIDGHNLVPHILGLNLQEIDDEEQLIALLQVFCRVRQTAVEVYFDGAPAGHIGMRKYGNVKAHFIRRGQKADDALASRLYKLGKEAANWTLVSSDHWVQAQGRGCRAKVTDSEEFARILADVITQNAASQTASSEILGAEEVNHWLEEFGKGGELSENDPPREPPLQKI
jgi:uncharacterized protein